MTDALQMPMPGFHVAIFARAPVAGFAKTRLIPLLGAEGAAEAHRKMVLRTVQTAVHASGGNVSIWSAGEDVTSFFETCMSRFGTRRFVQEGGNLGQRMAHCLHAMLACHEAVLLIGTDCPALSPADLQAAGNALQTGAQMVFTPAEDGGYVLAGARRGVHPACLDHAFDSVAWGTPDVMELTRRRMTDNGWRPGQEFAEMPMRWDVDEPDDYQRAMQLGLL